MDKDITYQGNALKIVLECLEHRYEYKHSCPFLFNMDRYAIVKGKHNCPNIFISLKKEFFLKYGEFAEKNNWRTADGKLEFGLGETLNVEDIKKLIKEQIQQIYFCYRDGKIYMIKVDDFLKLSHKWENKEGKEVRSASIHNFIRINKEEVLSEVMV